VRSDYIEHFGGLAALQARVDAFKQAIEAHKGTVGVPAPTEAALVEILARQNTVIEPYDPTPVPGSPPDVHAAMNAVNLAFEALTNRIFQLERRVQELPRHEALMEQIAAMGRRVDEGPKRNEFTGQFAHLNEQFAILRQRVDELSKAK
jgi:hypothetical protein